MSLVRSATRLSQTVKQTTFRRTFAGHGGDPDVPGVNAKRELLYGIGLGVALGFIWKQWQWKNKAERITNNNTWERQYNSYASKIKADLETAESE